MGWYNTFHNPIIVKNTALSRHDKGGQSGPLITIEIESYETPDWVLATGKGINPHPPDSS